LSTDLLSDDEEISQSGAKIELAERNSLPKSIQAESFDNNECTCCKKVECSIALSSSESKEKPVFCTFALTCWVILSILILSSFAILQHIKKKDKAIGNSLENSFSGANPSRAPTVTAEALVPLNEVLSQELKTKEGVAILQKQLGMVLEETTSQSKRIQKLESSQKIITDISKNSQDAHTSLNTKNLMEQRNDEINEIKNDIMKLKSQLSDTTSDKDEGKSDLWDGVKHVFQVGMPRTATTFQFQTLCIMVFIKFPNKKVVCNYQQWDDPPPGGILVTKTHDFDRTMEYIGPQSLYFATTPLPKDNYNHHVHSSHNKGWRPAKRLVDQFLIKADVSEVHRRQAGFVWEYQKIFDFDDNVMKEVERYFEKWDLLRQCCGSQMSADWRIEIRNGRPPPGKGEHLCKKEDIGQIERDYISLDIVKKLQNPDSGLKEMARPSEIDGDLDGNYCEYYNHGVKKCHWEGNSWMDVNKRKCP